MKVEDRQKLFDKMMEGAVTECDGDVAALVALEELTTKDLDAIEPIIDRMLAAAKQVAVEAFSKNGWKEGEFCFEVIPDGASCMVFIHAGNKKYAIEIDRSRLQNLCKYLIAESEK
jgi:hypothetical protein